jgi:hypothetical protein
MENTEFTNVDAELYGLDTDFGVQFSEHLRMDGVIRLCDTVLIVPWAVMRP